MALLKEIQKTELGALVELRRVCEKNNIRYFLAQGTLIGAARLMLETGRHPGALKDAVCSPGGATIQGVRALEAGGFRSAVMEAVIAAYEKSAEMK